MIKKSARFKYLICIYLLGILFFTLFRIAETVAYCSQSETPTSFDGLYWKALWMGFRFDTIISCYFLAIPLIMMIVGELAHIQKRVYYAIIHYLLMVLYTVAFFACAADIPYFCYFFNRLDIMALTLAGDGMGNTVSMILNEPQYLLYLGVFVATSVGWWLIGRLIYRRLLLANLDSRLPYLWSIPLAVVLLGIGFIGMRGKLSKIPVRVGTAYFCNNPFLNQIGLNPVFTFIKSVEEAGKTANRAIEYVDDTTVRELLQEQRNLPVDNSLAESALRMPEGMNVVLVLMESMTVNKTALHDPATSLTPCLDNLMKHSMTFTETYSAGVHTYNGIYSSLYGHPAIPMRHSMKSSHIASLCGLPQALSSAGYYTTYFMTHDEDYDNMRGFLYHNGFDRVVGQHDYPRSETVGTWGVPDHVMFKHVVEHCDSIAEGGPFFVCAMTCSDHAPYVYPEGISLKPKHEDIEQKMTEYADWSIGQFIKEASSRPWFDNTLFVFIADHGNVKNPVYDMVLSQNHVPLIFHAPGKIEPHWVERLALQIDVAPSILGLLGINDGGHMLGINLMNHVRPYAFFNADDKLGVVDGELFYIYRLKQDRASLYHYKDRSTVDLIDQLPERAALMRRYGFGMTQASQQMLLEGRTACEL